MVNIPSSKKSIFLETHHLDNLYTGFGQFNYNLVQALGKEHQFMEDHQLVISSDSEQIKRQLGEKFFYTRYSPLAKFAPFRCRKKYGIWHSVNQHTKIEPARADQPYMLTVHDINFIAEDKGDRLKFRVNQFKEKVNRSRAIVYVSEYAKQSTHDYFDIPDIPEHVIYNGNTIHELVGQSSFCPHKKETGSNPFIFTIGHLLEKKNFHTLIKMLRFLPDLNLVIAGNTKTKYGQFLKRLIQDYRMEHRIRLLGNISETEKIFYYRHCLAFAFPSLREGFGLPVLEAMTFGKPVFLSTESSLPEIGGKYSFYWKNFDPESMAKVFISGMSVYENNKNRYAQAYMERSQLFSWQEAARQYVNIYKSILQ